MRALAMLVLVLSAAPVITQALQPSEQLSPTSLSLEGEQPRTMPAGASQVIALTVEREIGDQPGPGPGWVDLSLEEGEEAGCQLGSERVALEPTTGRAETNLTCAPLEPMSQGLEVHARSPGSREDSWSTSLEVEPDHLEGGLATGEPHGSRFPANLTLGPQHLDQANVTLTFEGLLVEAPLGFRTQPVSLAADGSTTSHELVALQGSGTYTITAHAQGPLVHDWQAMAEVTVPPPSDGQTLEIGVEIEAANASLALINEPINDDGKEKNPGEEAITRFQVQGTDHVNVTVYRTAEDGEEIDLTHTIVETDEDDVAEHAFAYDPLPAGTLWVRGEAGDAQAERTVSVQDDAAGAELEGPKRVSHDGRAWPGNLTLRDDNFGSTPLDPGPLRGLPDVDWTVYKGRKWGSVEAEGFTVDVGRWSGGKNGTAPTSTVPWPEGQQHTTLGPGWARLPVQVQPPPEAELRDYRLSIYENASEDLLTSAPFELHQVTLAADEAPRAEQPWPIEVSVANLGERSHLELVLTQDGEPIANRNLTQATTWRPTLPGPLPADTELRLEAHAHGPDHADDGPPDAILTRTMEERAPRVEVRPILDGVPTTTPLALHPGHPHEVEIAYHAFDANTGPLDVSRVELTGPEGPPDWELQRPEEGLVHLAVPEGPQTGGYGLKMHLEGDTGATEEIGIDVGEIVRLSIEGPERLQLRQGEATGVDVDVTNRGNVPLEEVQLLLDTELSITARAWDGTAWIAEGEGIDLELEPGQTRTLSLELEPEDDAGEGELAITIAGVVP